MMARKEAKEKDRRFFGRRRKKEKKVIHYIHIVWPRKKKTRRNEANAAGEMHHVVYFLSFQVERQYTRNRVPKEKKSQRQGPITLFFFD